MKSIVHKSIFLSCEQLSQAYSFNHGGNCLTQCMPMTANIKSVAQKTAISACMSPALSFEPILNPNSVRIVTEQYKSFKIQQLPLLSRDMYAGQMLCAQPLTPLFNWIVPRHKWMVLAHAVRCEQPSKVLLLVRVCLLVRLNYFFTTLSLCLTIKLNFSFHTLCTILKMLTTLDGLSSAHNYSSILCSSQTTLHYHNQEAILCFDFACPHRLWYIEWNTCMGKFLKGIPVKEMSDNLKFKTYSFELILNVIVVVVGQQCYLLFSMFLHQFLLGFVLIFITLS